VLHAIPSNPKKGKVQIFACLAIGLAANHAEVVSVALANYPFLSELEKAQKALIERHKFSLKFTQILCNDSAMMLYNFINTISSIFLFIRKARRLWQK